MSWSKILAGVLALGTLAGCGFQSLYGTQSGGTRNPAVEGHLALIDVAPIPDRRGQILRNHLLDLLTPKGKAARPLYTLRVGLQVQEERLAVTTANLATRANLRVLASFSLTPRNTGGAPDGGIVAAVPNGNTDDWGGEGLVSRGSNVLYSGSRTVVASFDFFQNEFATLRGRQDAEERALRDIAAEIETQIAVFFAGKTKNPAARVGTR